MHIEFDRFKGSSCLPVQFVLLFFVFNHYVIGQVPVNLDGSLHEQSLEGSYTTWRTSIFESTSTPQVMSALKDGSFTNRPWNSFKPMWLRGNYYYWLQWALQNVAEDTLDIFITGAYDPVGVYVIKDEALTEISFMGHASTIDPNQLLATKNRIGFTYRMAPGQCDTFVYKIFTPSLRSPFNMVVYNIDHYYAQFMSNLQWPTLLNGAFIGLMVMIFFGSIYFLIRSGEKYMLWYTLYIFMFLIYYWRDFEFWNPYFDYSHQWLSWYQTKVPLGLSIFVFYSLFIHSILNSKDYFPQLDKAQRWIIWGSLIVWILDLLLLGYYPFGSLVLAYVSAFSIAVIQLYLLYPAWKKQKNDLVVNRLVIGTLALFTGWLTILFFPVQIHQYTIRIFTLIELICFSTAIIERMVQVFKHNQAMLLEQELALVEERDRISAEMHDDLSGSITAIGYLSKLGHEVTSEEARRYFGRIEDLSRQVTQGMTDIIWLMNSRNQSVAELSLYIHSYSLDFLQTQGIDLDYVEEIAQGEIMLNNNLRKDVLLSVKECLHNIQKHAQATRVTIRVVQAQDKINIEVKDNGIGMRNKKHTLSGNGLINISTRMKRHQGYANWNYDNGICVSMEVTI